MKNKNLEQFPSITTVIATYNSEKTLKQCLESIRSQDYSQRKVDIILCDGGSTDSTRKIAKGFNVDFVAIPPDLQNAEYNKGIGVRKAKGELLLMVDHDNVLPHKNWLKSMVIPLINHPEVTASTTLRFTYNANHSIIDRYIALFGATDPVAYYLGKADRLSYIYDTYNLYGKSKDMGSYYIVAFDKDHIPTLGANGFLIRKKTLMENALIDEKHFYHIDVNVDLIQKGFNKYAFVKDGIIHLTGYKSIWGFLQRRKLFMEQYHIRKHSTRRYSVYEPQDLLKLIKFIIYSVTLIKPTLDAVRGYMKIHDIAWFLIPFLSFTLLNIYGFVVIKNLFRGYEKQHS